MFLQTMATRISECAFVRKLLHLHLLPSFWINRLCPSLLVGSRTLTQSPRGRLSKNKALAGLIRGGAADALGLCKDYNLSLVMGQINLYSRLAQACLVIGNLGVVVSKDTIWSRDGAERMEALGRGRVDSHARATGIDSPRLVVPALCLLGCREGPQWYRPHSICSHSQSGAW